MPPSISAGWLYSNHIEFGYCVPLGKENGSSKIGEILREKKAFSQLLAPHFDTKPHAVCVWGTYGMEVKYKVSCAMESLRPTTTKLRLF